MVYKFGEQVQSMIIVDLSHLPKASEAVMWTRAFVKSLSRMGEVYNSLPKRSALVAGDLCRNGACRDWACRDWPMQVVR